MNIMVIVSRIIFQNCLFFLLFLLFLLKYSDLDDIRSSSLWPARLVSTDTVISLTLLSSCLLEIFSIPNVRFLTADDFISGDEVAGEVSFLAALLHLTRQLFLFSGIEWWKFSQAP